MTTEWIGVSKAEQKKIVAAIKELNEGKGIAHQDVMTGLRNKTAHT